MGWLDQMISPFYYLCLGIFVNFGPVDIMSTGFLLYNGLHMVMYDNKNNFSLKDYNKLERKKSGRYIKLRKGIFFACVVCLCVLIGFVIILLKNRNTSTDTLIQSSQEDMEHWTLELSDIMIIPDEKPTIFVLSQVDSLVKDEPFFINAQDGDILFIFPQTLKAVIYSPERKRVVNVGPVMNSQQQIQYKPTEESSPQVEMNTQPSEVIIEE